MTHTDAISRLLDETKTRSDAEIHLSWSPMIRLFIAASKAERSESASAFHRWAEANVDEQPLKFYYSKLLSGADHLLNDTHEVALPLLLEARNGCEKHGDRDGIAACSLFLGQVYRARGNLELALKTLQEPFTHFNQTGRYPILLAGNCHSLAELNLQLQNYEEAFSIFQTGYETSLKIGDAFFPVHALNGMGRARMLQDRLGEAEGFFNKAQEEARAIGNPMQLGDSLIELASFNVRTGNLALAEQLNQRALATHDGKFPGAEITCCINLGEIYLKQSRWSEAVEVLDKGLALAERIQSKPKMSQVHLLLSKVYRGMGDAAQSLSHHEAFHELREKVLEEDNARKLIDAKLIFEAEQTQKENVVIKRQKQEIEDKNLQLQQYIDELTIVKISRKARGITLFVGIALIVAEDPVFGYVLSKVGEGNFLLSITAKIIIIFSLRPINIAIESYLLRRFVLKNRHLPKSQATP
jgi:tetratricopeptide (TPR) repeat protein